MNNYKSVNSLAFAGKIQSQTEVSMQAADFFKPSENTLINTGISPVNGENTEQKSMKDTIKKWVNNSIIWIGATVAPFTGVAKYLKMSEASKLKRYSATAVWTVIPVAVAGVTGGLLGAAYHRIKNNKD